MPRYRRGRSRASPYFYLIRAADRDGPLPTRAATSSAAIAGGFGNGLLTGLA